MIQDIILALSFAVGSLWWARRSWAKGYVAGYTAGAIAARDYLMGEPADADAKTYG